MQLEIDVHMQAQLTMKSSQAHMKMVGSSACAGGEQGVGAQAQPSPWRRRREQAAAERRTGVSVALWMRVVLRLVNDADGG